MKDIDGAREVQFLLKGSSVFMWGVNFSYEFDAGIFGHQIVRMLSTMEEAEEAPN